MPTKLKEKNIFFFLIFLAACSWYAPNYWRSVWWDKWFYVMGAMVAFMSFHVGKRFRAASGFLFFILTFKALWVFGWRMSYPQIDVATLLAIGKVTAYTAFSLVLMVACFFFFDGETHEKAGDLAACLCVVNAIVMVVQAATGRLADARGGIFGNPSISGCFLAFTYPYLVLQPRVNIPHPSLIAFLKRAFYVAVPVYAMLLAGASQPVAVLILVLLAYQWHRHGTSPAPYPPKLSRKIALSLFIVIIGGALLAYFNDPRMGTVFSSSGRTRIWAWAFSFWSHSEHQWTGFGTGISQIFLPMVQQTHLSEIRGGPYIDWWLWFHSDWLQLLFENGIWGLIGGVWFFYTALKSAARKSSWLFSAVVGVGATALFNFPAHFPIHAFIGAVIFAQALDRKYLPIGPNSFYN